MNLTLEQKGAASLAWQVKDDNSTVYWAKGRRGRYVVMRIGKVWRADHCPARKWMGRCLGLVDTLEEAKQLAQRDHEAGGAAAPASAPAMAKSPTFVARFADGKTTRMTTFCAGGRLDLKRGVRLSCHAYRSHMKKEPPALESACFEHNGVTLASYTAEQIAEVAP
jgi:hypothetical protein